MTHNSAAPCYLDNILKRGEETGWEWGGGVGGKNNCPQPYTRPELIITYHVQKLIYFIYLHHVLGKDIKHLFVNKYFSFCETYKTVNTRNIYRMVLCCKK